MVQCVDHTRMPVVNKRKQAGWCICRDKYSDQYTWRSLMVSVTAALYCEARLRSTPPTKQHATVAKINNALSRRYFGRIRQMAPRNYVFRCSLILDTSVFQLPTLIWVFVSQSAGDEMIVETLLSVRFSFGSSILMLFWWQISITVP